MVINSHSGGDLQWKGAKRAKRNIECSVCTVWENEHQENEVNDYIERDVKCLIKME